MSEPIKLTKDNIDITSNVYGYFVQIQFRLDEKEKAKQLKQQIIHDQKIIYLCNFLDFDAILFALYRDLKFKHNNSSESHLHLKIAQVKKLKKVLKNKQ